MSTCNQVDLETLGFLPIMPKTSPKSDSVHRNSGPTDLHSMRFLRGGRWVLHSQVIRQAKPNGSKPNYGSFYSLPTWYSDAGQHAIQPLGPH